MKKKIHEISPITKVSKESILMLPTPSNISYFWNFGSLLGMNLMIQIITGIFISMHYAPESSMAFESTVHISRDVNLGWFMRLIHMNGASMFFIFIYTHISRGMMFSSFKKKETWSTGIIMLFILMGTAFLGYVLPWGQMSFWGATVITNLLSAIPFLGEEIVKWLWGGFSVSNSTLNRFFSLHFLMPFILSTVTLIHIMTLHESGSSNPLGLKSNLEKTMFHPLYSWKDLLAPAVIFTLFLFLMMKSPWILGDPENFNPANPMTTPVHIQPEWYFLFAYAILRSIPNKLGGVIALVMSIFILFLLPTLKKVNSSSKFSPKKKFMFWTMASSFMILTWAGAKQIESPFDSISKTFSLMYFFSMIML